MNPTRTLPERTAVLVRDLVLLAARTGLGVVLIAHGWQKLVTNGLGSTADGFASSGVPLPEVAATVAAGVELIGGTALVLGLLTPVAGLLVAGVMAGAFWFVHRDGGLFASGGGWELVVMIGLLALTVAATGPGRLSVGHWISRGRREPRASRSVVGSAADREVLARG